VIDMRTLRHRVLAGFAGLCAALLSIFPVLAQDGGSDDIRFVRIGTGPTGGTYFPMGGLIANAISNPPGSRACEKGGSCGVPGLIAVAQSTGGSVENVDAIGRGELELALVQTDVAYWASHGTGIYREKGPVPNLRAIAKLYDESIHLVARKDAGIASVTDLVGKTVSLGSEGSGSLVDALAILDAYGVDLSDLTARYLRPGASADALRAGEIDAFFFIAGPPVLTVGSLLNTGKAELVPIDGEPARQLAQRFPFLEIGRIPHGVYDGVPAVRTLNVATIFVCDAALPDDLVYGITRALWHPSNRSLFHKGHPVGMQMRPDMAAKGLGIPLHSGAAQFYFDADLVR